MTDIPWLEKMSIESESLQSKFRIISVLILFFPFAAFLYVMQGHGLLFRAENQAGAFAVFMAFLLVLAALIMLHEIFRRFVDIAIALKKASAGETVNLEISRGTPELREVSRSFNNLLRQYEETGRELKHHSLGLLALKELVEIASKSLEMEKMLSALLDKAMTVSEASAGSVFLIEGRPRRFRIVAAAGPAAKAGKDALIPFNGSPARLAVRDKKPVLVTNIEEDPRFGRPNKSAYVSPSFLCLPISINRKVIGVVNLAAKRTQETFNEDDVRFLSLMIGEIRFALENARLYAELKENNKRLQKQAIELNEEIARRKKVENELSRHQRHLEELVSRRTKELEAARDRAEAANRTKSAFLANISHELRTPLTAITGFSELMADGLAGPVSKKQQKYLQDIIESSHELLALINNLLDLSKMEVGEMELQLSTFEVRELLETTLSLAMETAKAKGLEVTMDVEEDTGEITADVQKIRQVIHNLLANAIKFTPNGSISVYAGKMKPETGESVEDSIIIKVADTGIGITAEDQEKLFCHFLQLDDSLSRHYGGAGLGLILSRKIVELHGGHIWVESTPGEGSVFGFTLPVRPGTAEQ
ncbi:MAG: ATP-binding protein [Mariprofundaceae bacterium]|nr:ATP-binding protein [Mariprofundaceae bacterium]